MGLNRWWGGVKFVGGTHAVIVSIPNVKSATRKFGVSGVDSPKNKNPLDPVCVLPVGMAKPNEKTKTVTHMICCFGDPTNDQEPYTRVMRREKIVWFDDETYDYPTPRTGQYQIHRHDGPGSGGWYTWRVGESLEARCLAILTAETIHRYMINGESKFTKEREPRSWTFWEKMAERGAPEEWEKTLSYINMNCDIHDIERKRGTW